jgi:hypothetical protein
MSTTWWLAATPRSAASCSAAPHSHAPAGKCGTVASGFWLQARCDPFDPGCPPGLRPPPLPRFGLGCGGVQPGRSSADGAIEEFPLFRETSRSSRSSRAARSAASARSCVITLSRPATARSRSASRLTSSARDNGSYPATHKDQHISDDDARITTPRVSSSSPGAPRRWPPLPPRELQPAQVAIHR